MIIQVKQEHIDNGRPNNCKYCAIALALSDAFDEPCTCGINFCGPEHRLYKVPQNVRDFIFRFDDNQQVNPFSFELYYK